MNIGTPELLLVLLVVLLLFGGAKLPSPVRRLGQAKREFKAGRDDATSTPPSSR